jgi:hypothetical protein
MVEISHGLGKYAAVIQADGDGYRTLLKARQVHMISIVAGIALVKVSVSFFLLRLATRRIYSWCLWGLIGFLITFTLVCMGTLVSHTAYDLPYRMRYLLGTHSYLV